MSVEREERERRREHRARVAIRGGRDEHRGDGAASECLAPIPLRQQGRTGHVAVAVLIVGDVVADRKSTRLNSSHSQISYAVFCLKKKKKNAVFLWDYKVRHIQIALIYSVI